MLRAAFVFALGLGAAATGRPPPPLPQAQAPPLAALASLALDTDIGTDMDDAWALTYLLSRSQPGDPARLFDFKLVVCSTYNTTNRARIAAKFMSVVGRFDVPIAVGLYTGEDAMPQLPVADGFQLSDFVAAGGTVTYGTGALRSLMAAATPAAPLFVVEIAPATSLGGIVAAEPALAANVIVSAMSGSVSRGYSNSSRPSAEYNVARNISASQAMYASAWLSPLMTAPLDTSGLLQCFAPEYLELLAANSSAAHPYAYEILRNYLIWCGGSVHNSCGGFKPSSPATGTSLLYDAQAAYMMSIYATAWAAHGNIPPAMPFLTLQVLPMSVNASGYTVIDAAGQPVWPATEFPEGYDLDTHSICTELFTYIIAGK